METVLIVSQIFFYFSVSLAIVVIGVLCIITLFHLVRITKELERISRDFRNASGDVLERIRDIVEMLSELPILSFLLKRAHRRKDRKKAE